MFDKMQIDLQSLPFQRAINVTKFFIFCDSACIRLIVKQRCRDRGCRMPSVRQKWCRGLCRSTPRGGPRGATGYPGIGEAPAPAPQAAGGAVRTFACSVGLRARRGSIVDP